MRPTCWFVIAASYRKPRRWLQTHTHTHTHTHACMQMSDMQVDTAAASASPSPAKQAMKYGLPAASTWIMAVWHCSAPEARFSAPPLQSFHPSLHLVSRATFLLSHKKRGPVCFTSSRQEAWRTDKTIISLAAAAAAAARAGARTADRILKQAAVLAQIAAAPASSSLCRSLTCPTAAVVCRLFPPGHQHSQTDFPGLLWEHVWLNMSCSVFVSSRRNEGKCSTSASFADDFQAFHFYQSYWRVPVSSSMWVRSLFKGQQEDKEVRCVEDTAIWGRFTLSLTGPF